MPLRHHGSEAPGFEDALRHAAQPQYLGDVQTVDALIRSLWIGTAERREKFNSGEMSRQAMLDGDKAAAFKIADIFRGKDPTFPTQPNWNSGHQLPAALAQRLDLDSAQGADNIVRSALGLMLSEIYGLLADDTLDDPKNKWKVDAAIDFWTSLFLGSIDITHPRSEE